MKEEVTINQMDIDWENFSVRMMEHIGLQRGKYRINDQIELAQLLPAGWALGDAIKYLYEVVRWLDDPEIMSKRIPKETALENLLKSAHCVEICFSKIARS